MGGEWRNATLGDVIELKRGYDLPSSNRVEGSVPIVSSSGVSGSHSVSMAKGPGVITGRYGTIGLVHYVRDDFWPLNTTLYVRDFKRSNPRFVAYYLTTLDFNAYSDKGAVPGVNRNHLHEAKVVWPPLAEQKSIADLLGALDDKIELNRRMAETLEATARTLFKSWFIDFDPIHAKSEGCPTGLSEDLAALFPDKWGDNRLPAGWTLSTVGGLFEISGGNTPSTAVPENWDGPHQWATPKDLSGIDYPVLLQTERTITDAGLARSTSGLLPAGSLLLSSRAPIGYMAFASRPVAVNQGFAGFVRREVTTAYAWGWCSENMDIIRGNAGGSTFPEISKSVLRGLPMLKPSEAILAAFDDAVGPLLARLIAAAEQSETLATLRDTLLPKLITGELRIRDADHAVAAA